VALQAPLNAALGRALGSPLAAACVSFGVGFAVLALITLALQGAAPFRALAAVPRGLLAGGLLGAFFVWAMLWAVPAVGVLTAVAALILGQLAMALVLDATGALGLAAQPVSPARLAAAALVAAGVVLSRA
jgi:transporter family-2 protein